MKERQQTVFEPMSTLVIETEVIETRDTSEVLDGLVAEEPQITWPETDPTGIPTEEQYLQRCRWRLGNVGHALDVVRDKIDNEADAVKWEELKKVIHEAKSISDMYAIVDPMLAIEEEGYAFVKRLGMDRAAFLQVANH